MNALTLGQNNAISENYTFSSFSLFAVDEKGEPYHSSLLSEVLETTREVEDKNRLTTQSQAHENKVNMLKKRKAVCEETIRVIDETNSRLNDCT